MTVRDKTEHMAECFQRIRECAACFDHTPDQTASSEELREWRKKAEAAAAQIADELDGVNYYARLFWPV